MSLKIVHTRKIRTLPASGFGLRVTGDLECVSIYRVLKGRIGFIVKDSSFEARERVFIVISPARSLQYLYPIAAPLTLDAEHYWGGKGLLSEPMLELCRGEATLFEVEWALEREPNLARVFDAAQAATGTCVERNKTPSAIGRRIKELIDENFTQPIFLRDLAAGLRIPPSYVGRYFCADFGITAAVYRQNIRLALARYQLEMGGAPRAVCQSVGFANYTTFSSNFADMFGDSPRKILAKATLASATAPLR